MLHRDFQREVTVTGIYARQQSVEHAIDLCMAYAPTGFVYTDYAQMLSEAEADFVYIANANHVHYPYALQAIQTGHSVIVEKPLTVTREETEALYDAAMRYFKENGVKTIPTVKRIQDEIEDLTSQKNAGYTEYRESQKRERELQTVKANIETILRQQEPEIGQERKTREEPEIGQERKTREQEL